MKIDLHCHTIAIKKGDNPGRNVTADLFAEKIANAGVKIVAITNHNFFDIDQYKEFKERVREYCHVWPGVEIDVKRKSRWHLIVVSNPDNVELFNLNVKHLFEGKNLDKVALNIDDVFSALNQCDVIYIPHYHKNPGINEEDRQYLENLINDDSRLFLELTNHRSLGVYTNYGFKSIIGSDVKDWNNYEKCSFAELKLPVDSFQQFCLLSKRDRIIVETLLNRKQSVVLNAKPHPSVKVQLKLFQDVNILFGPKGTGKSEILKSLYEEMLAHGMNCEKYFASEKNADITALLSTANMERTNTTFGVDSCDEEFQIIREWTDTTPVSFMLYKNWYDTRNNSEHKKRMKITEAPSIVYYKPEKYDQHKVDKSLICSIHRAINQIHIHDYLDENSSKVLISLLTELENHINEKRRSDFIDEYSTNLANKTIELIKHHADRSTDTVSRPSSTGLVEFMQNRLELRKAVDKILTILSSPEKKEHEKIGELEGKGDIFITTRYRFLCEDSRREEFDKKSGIKRLRKIVSLLKTIQRDVFNENIAVIVKELVNELDDAEVMSIKPFIGVSKYITDKDKNRYSASNGEQGIILLQRVLQKDADAYFLDEPELGMGNSYIDVSIRPLIMDLARRRKYVVIATHNANLAVRTLPYMSIYRTHENGVYNTYVGNPFIDSLVNIENEEDIKTWSEESLHSLEGGHDAFYERKDIYESKNN